MAATYNATADQGATFLLAITWTQADGVTPVDVTGYEAYMQVRTKAGAPVAVISASTLNGQITLGGADGLVSVNVPASVMMGVLPNAYKYDLEVFSPASTPIVTRLIQGTFTVNAAVTVVPD
jgi:hypothetical protein